MKRARKGRESDTAGDPDRTPAAVKAALWERYGKARAALRAALAQAAMAS